MIFDLLYLIYEYIEKNKEKLYSKDFPALLRNLLPSQYETENKKFLYKEYYFIISILFFCWKITNILNSVYYEYGK